MSDDIRAHLHALAEAFPTWEFLDRPGGWDGLLSTLWHMRIGNTWWNDAHLATIAMQALAALNARGTPYQWLLSSLDGQMWLTHLDLRRTETLGETQGQAYDETDPDSIPRVIIEQIVNALPIAELTSNAAKVEPSP